MSRPCLTLLLIGALAACAAPNRLVYSSGFSFANYDYVFLAKPDGQGGSTLHGLDIEFANTLNAYNMKVIGDKEYAGLAPEQQKRTLFARMSAANNDKRIIFSVSFDDATTGRTGSSITSTYKGDLFDEDDRQEAFESVSATVVKALQRDKALVVSSDKSIKVPSPQPVAAPVAAPVPPPAPIAVSPPPGTPVPLPAEPASMPAAPVPAETSNPPSGT